MATRKLEPVHPGEVLREDVMVPLGLTINGLARDLKVPPMRISDVVNGKRGITTDTALRLARYLGTSAQFWLNLQTTYELQLAEETLAKQVAAEVRPRTSAA